MGSAERSLIAALLALGCFLASADAQDGVHGARRETARACLNQKERRLLVESGKVLHLSAAMRTVRSRVAGTLLRARLCRGTEGLVYVLTVLAHDGKVWRVAVDAVKGTPAGGL